MREWTNVYLSVSNARHGIIIPAEVASLDCRFESGEYFNFAFERLARPPRSAWSLHHSSSTVTHSHSFALGHFVDNFDVPLAELLPQKLSFLDDQRKRNEYKYELFLKVDEKRRCEPRWRCQD